MKKNLRSFPIKINISLLFVLLLLSVSIISAQKPDVTAESVFVGDAATVIEMPIPEYPIAAMGLKGKITVLVDIDESGSVTAAQDATGPGNVCPSATDPAVLSLREAAISAAKGAKFVPSTVEGKAVTRKARIEYTFGPINSDGTDISVNELSRASANPENSQAATAPKAAPADTTDSNVTLGVNKIGTIGNAQLSTNPVERGNAKVLRTDSSGGRTVAGGVLNGKAVSLPLPSYPAAAKAVRASGAVSVQVLITEDGSIYSASAVSGHPLLRNAAGIAACSARFSPTLLSGTRVKVSGIIVYNFVP